MKIGIDIGNVIIGGGGNDTQFFTEDFWDTPSVPDAYRSIVALHQASHELHLVSKCGPKIEGRSMLWLETYGFLAYPMASHRVHFVRKRHLKAPMAQALELDIFIDDRQDIIDSLQGVVKFPILFTSWEETNKQLKEIFETT